MSGNSPAWRKPFRRAAELVEEGGVEHLLVRGFGKLASPALTMGSLIFFRRDLRHEMPAPDPIPRITLRFATLNDALLLGSNEPAIVELMHQRLERGDLCCVGTDDAGALAHYRWAAVRPTYIPELDRYFSPGPSEAYLYDLLTAPGFRGCGIDTQSRLLVYSRLLQNNINAIHCYVRADNPTALKVARKWHKEVGRVWYLRLSGLPPLVIGARKLEDLRHPKLVGY